ncbi:MAG TPA: membrane protein insertion efficiency factor YidD [Candidatus Marinimicrobia bacterium]|nr:membrane protein insertion efficiency factor YidD [Nitrospinota bacterium]HBR86797.1 membrane protein insertion efficiency factor YidD [Candidatus Neomarinimicrobiota bacterium]
MDLLKPIFIVLDRSVAFLFLSIVYVYKHTLSPFLGNRCRFHPTCSSYALQALKTKNTIRACVLIIKRLSKCHPLHSGGFDPVK